MLIERRRYPRIKRSLPVSVSRHGRAIGTFKTLDLGLDGLSINAADHAFVNGGSLVLHLETGLETKAIEGRIVHRTTGAIGIRVADRYRHHSDMVLDAMRRHARPPPGAQATERAAFEQALIKDEGSGSLLLVVGERLDFTAMRSFLDAVGMIRERTVHWVLVDMSSTRQVFDSGMGLLLTLLHRVDALAKKIVLVNCAPSVLERLDEAGLSRRFPVA